MTFFANIDKCKRMNFGIAFDMGIPVSLAFDIAIAVPLAFVVAIAFAIAIPVPLASGIAWTLVIGFGIAFRFGMAVGFERPPVVFDFAGAGKLTLKGFPIATCGF